MCVCVCDCVCVCINVRMNTPCVERQGRSVATVPRRERRWYTAIYAVELLKRQRPSFWYEIILELPLEIYPQCISSHKSREYKDCKATGTDKKWNPWQTNGVDQSVHSFLHSSLVWQQPHRRLGTATKYRSCHFFSSKKGKRPWEGAENISNQWSRCKGLSKCAAGGGDSPRPPWLRKLKPRK